MSHHGTGREAIFEVLWKSGDRSWEMYSTVKNWTALEAYCEAQGITSISLLKRGNGNPPDDIQIRGASCSFIRTEDDSENEFHSRFKISSSSNHYLRSSMTGSYDTIDMVDYEPSPVNPLFDLPAVDSQDELTSTDATMSDTPSRQPELVTPRPSTPHPNGIDRSVSDMLNRLVMVEARIVAYESIIMQLLAPRVTPTTPTTPSTVPQSGTSDPRRRQDRGLSRMAPAVETARGRRAVRRQATRDYGVGEIMNNNLDSSRPYEFHNINRQRARAPYQRHRYSRFDNRKRFRTPQSYVIRWIKTLYKRLVGECKDSGWWPEFLTGSRGPVGRYRSSRGHRHGHLNYGIENRGRLGRPSNARAIISTITALLSFCSLVIVTTVVTSILFSSI